MLEDEATLIAAIITLALQFGRYGYRRITALLRRDGWTVNVKRVERIWRREGLEVPARQPKRARLWLNDGSCLRLRPERPDHVWSYDFVEHRTHNGRKYRMLNVIDEFTRECLAIRIARKLKAYDVIDVLSDLFSLRGVPGHIRSDNGPEFIFKAVQDWIAAVGSVTAYIEPGSPWENGYCESFNAKLRDELLNGEVFYTLKEASVVIEQRRKDYILSDRTRRWASSHLHQRSSSGQRNRADQCRPLALPSSPDRRCTNFELGPPHGGRPKQGPAGGTQTLLNN
jgi:transposase InsO family protein